MRLRRWIAALTALLLMLSAALAEEILPEETPMPSEEVRAFVEAMFAAATGTTAGQEKEAREGLTQEELAARNAAGAEYRSKTIRWLIEAFAQEKAAEPVPTPAPDALPVRTAVDGFAAMQETEAGREYLAKLAEMGGEDMETCLQITREICGMWMAEIDHARLTEMNGDYRCWIYAPGTQIDYPIVQREDNSHYLKRMFNGERNSAGTLFIDYRNLPGFQDPNTLVYGHHMRNDSMFGTLTDYAEQAYFEGHPFMLVMAKEEIFLVEIYAGYTTSDQDHCYDIAISDEEDMRAFIEEAQRKSDFMSGVDVQTTDRLVTLSTCAYAFEDARYIAIGRIVPVWVSPVGNAADASE